MTITHYFSLTTATGRRIAWQWCERNASHFTASIHRNTLKANSK